MQDTSCKQLQSSLFMQDTTCKQLKQSSMRHNHRCNHQYDTIIDTIIQSSIGRCDTMHSSAMRCTCRCNCFNIKIPTSTDHDSNINRSTTDHPQIINRSIQVLAFVGLYRGESLWIQEQDAMQSPIPYDVIVNETRRYDAIIDARQSWRFGQRSVICKRFDETHT